MTERETIIQVRGLQKTFRIGFFRKRVDAVRGIDFEVKQGGIFGLLGPNGAGKTTTIKMMLRLIFPSAGDIRIFGRPPGDPEATRRIGYMPENPYIYQYLRPAEFLDLCGRLVGMESQAREKRSAELIEQVGLSHAADRPIGKFSKGMMQRIGLAQALLHDPELLILDEPMSGLDPIGRKQVRDLLMEQRRRGKTLLFTSHILSDVEMMCDRVVIMQHGKITSAGDIDELLGGDSRRVEVQLAQVEAALGDQLVQMGKVLQRVDGKLSLQIEGREQTDAVIKRAMQGGAELVALIPERETLENLFMRDAAR